MTKHEFEQKVKQFIYNTKKYSKADLIRGMEQILRETNESVINIFDTLINLEDFKEKLEAIAKVLQPDKLVTDKTDVIAALKNQSYEELHVLRMFIDVEIKHRDQERLTGQFQVTLDS